MKLYIGASDKKQAQEAAVLLGAVMGHELTSRWFDGEKPKAKDVESWKARAAENYAALDRAEAMVGLFAGKWPGPGVHAEVGYALGKGLPVVVFAPLGLPTPMMYHPLLTWVKTADELEAAVQKVAEEVSRDTRFHLNPISTDSIAANNVAVLDKPKTSKRKAKASTTPQGA